MHAKIEWSAVLSTNLWPFSLKLAVETHNHLSFNDHGLFTISIVAGVEEDRDILDYRPFRFPVFVLDEQNQSGLRVILKQDPKSRSRVYLGCSPVHTSSMALVLNLSTGHVIPRYHLVFDDDFSIASYLHSNNTQPPNWIDLIKNDGCNNDTAETSL